MNFFESKKVKLYPTAYRGKKDPEDILYNPESRLPSEYNISNAIYDLTHKRDGFVIAKTGNTIEFVLHGYHFEIDISDINFNNRYLWVALKLVARGTKTEDDPDNIDYADWSLGSLKNIVDTDLETTVSNDNYLDENNLFYGIGYDFSADENSPFTNADAELCIWDNTDGVVPEKSLLTLNSNFIEDETNGVPITENFTVNNINASNISAAAASVGIFTSPVNASTVNASTVNASYFYGDIAHINSDVYTYNVYTGSLFTYSAAGITMSADAEFRVISTSAVNFDLNNQFSVFVGAAGISGGNITLENDNIRVGFPSADYNQAVVPAKNAFISGSGFYYGVNLGSHSSRFANLYIGSIDAEGGINSPAYYGTVIDTTYAYHQYIFGKADMLSLKASRSASGQYYGDITLTAGKSINMYANTIRLNANTTYAGHIEAVNMSLTSGGLNTDWVGGNGLTVEAYGGYNLNLTATNRTVNVNAQSVKLNATAANTQLTTDSVGNVATPIYLNQGVPTQCNVKFKAGHITKSNSVTLSHLKYTAWYSGAGDRLEKEWSGGTDFPSDQSDNQSIKLKGSYTIIEDSSTGDNVLNMHLTLDAPDGFRYNSSSTVQDAWIYLKLTDIISSCIGVTPSSIKYEYSNVLVATKTTGNLNGYQAKTAAEIRESDGEVIVFIGIDEDAHRHKGFYIDACINYKK